MKITTKVNFAQPIANKVKKPLINTTFLTNTLKQHNKDGIGPAMALRVSTVTGMANDTMA